MTSRQDIRKEENIKKLIEKRKEEFAKRVKELDKQSQERKRIEEKIKLKEEEKERLVKEKEKERLAKLKERLANLGERKRIKSKKPVTTKTTEEFKFTEEEKEKCRKKTLEELIDEMGGSILTCPPGKELKKEISPRELTVDLACFRKRIRKKNPKQIREAYDKLLEYDPERLCKDKE